MPVKIWERSSDGSLSSSIATSRPAGLRGEEFRTVAHALDQEIDKVLDRAIELTPTDDGATADKQLFVNRWAIGRALAETDLLTSDNLEPQEYKFLWLAIARKCRLGVRADGGPENRWHGLIPGRESDPRRIERDVFSVSLWLQEQSTESAMMAFGSKLSNAREIHRRGAINSKKLRDALSHWFENQGTARRAELTNGTKFVALAKAMAARWPARGPGSAKRPVHYSEQELYNELCKTLDPLVEDLLQGLVPQPNGDTPE